MISELIDLTEHRDFGGRIRSTNLRLESEMSFWDSIHKRINYELYGKIIWRIDLKDEYIPFDGIFPLGTKKQRKEIKESAYWGTLESEVCDCCGRKIKKIPWKKDWGICDICNKQIKKEINFPWM